MRSIEAGIICFICILFFASAIKMYWGPVLRWIDPDIETKKAKLAEAEEAERKLKGLEEYPKCLYHIRSCIKGVASTFASAIVFYKEYWGKKLLKEETNEDREEI